MRTIEMGVKSISIFLALIISMIFCPSVSKGSVDPPTVDFGEVGVGSSSTITLQVTNNPNEEDLNVSFYMYDDAGCGFSIVSDVSEGVSLSAGQSVDVDIRYEPSGLGECSAKLYITYADVGVLAVPVKGIGVEAATSGTIVIDSRDTGVEDQLYGDQPISDWIKQCEDEAGNRCQYVRCISQLTRELAKEGIITRKEKHIIRWYAMQANIPFKETWVENSVEGTLVIGGHDTGVEDQFYDGLFISEWIKQCAGEGKNHRKFVRCISQLTMELAKEGIITRKEKHIIQRYAHKAFFLNKRCQKHFGRR